MSDPLMGPVEAGLIASAEAAKHLTPMDDAALAAAKALARKIDQEDTLRAAYVAWYECNDMEPPGPLRLDNVSVPTFLKYCDSLGLTPAGRSKSPAAPGPEKPKSRKDEVKERRERRRAASAGDPG